MGHYFLKIIWYSYDLHVSFGLYCSSVDKSLTLVKEKRKTGSKYMRLKYDVFSQMRVTVFKRSFVQTYVYVTACFVSWRGAITELWISLVQYVFTLIHWHRKQWHPSGHVTLYKCGKLPQRRYTLQIVLTPDPKWPLIFIPVESPLITGSKSVWSAATILIKK